MLEKWVLAASCPCRRLLVSACGGEFHPRAWYQQDQPLYTLWHKKLFPLHIMGCQSPQGSTVPTSVMGFLIFKALQHPKFISRSKRFHLVTSSQAYVPKVYCSLSWQVNYSELS